MWKRRFELFSITAMGPPVCGYGAMRTFRWRRLLDESANASMLTAMRLDPRFDSMWLHFLAQAYFGAGRYEGVAAALRRRNIRRPDTDVSRVLTMRALENRFTRLAARCRVGYEGRFDYTAIGSVVNLAARLCERARADEILVDNKVHAAIEGFMEATPLGNFTPKGFSRPIGVFNIAVPQDENRSDEPAAFVNPPPNL